MDDPRAEPVDDTLERLFGSGSWIQRLIDIHPALAEGLRRLAELATADGALPASTKLLFAGAIAAVKGEPQIAEAALSAAFAAGATRSQAEGAAAAVLVSRGLPAFMALSTLIEASARSPDAPGRDDVDVATVAEILSYVEEIYGDVPERVRLMVDELPNAIEGFHLLRSAGLRGAGLDAKATELLLVALNSALLESEFVKSHARDARDEGASETELAEAVATAIPFGGMAAWHAGATAITESRSLGSRRRD